MDFQMFDLGGLVVNILLYVWCDLYLKVLFLMRVLDYVTFSVYINMF